MSSLCDLENPGRRLRRYVEQRDILKPEAAGLLEEALIRAQFERGRALRITGPPERSARRLLNAVIAEGLLASATPKGSVSIRFPAHALDIPFPRPCLEA